MPQVGVGSERVCRGTPDTTPGDPGGVPCIGSSVSSACWTGKMRREVVLMWEGVGRTHRIQAARLL